MENIVFALNGIVPIFGIVLFGFFLKRKNIINEEFASVCSKIVFVAALPAMLFRDVATSDISSVFDIRFVLFAMAALIVMLMLAQTITSFFIKEKFVRGAFVQGIIRSNYAIFGLSISSNLFGPEGLAKSALLLAFVTPLVSVLCVIALSINAPHEIKTDVFKIIRNVVKNPIVIAIVLAIPFSLFGITIPTIAINSINYVAQLAIPLALIGIGGSFSFSDIQKRMNMSIIATLLRNVLIPFIFIVVAIFAGFRGAEAGILFILFASPTAISSYVFARAMGSDAELTSNIILVSTLSSIVTITLGIFILKTLAII